MKLDHERLDVYQVGLDFSAWANDAKEDKIENVNEDEDDKEAAN